MSQAYRWGQILFSGVTFLRQGACKGRSTPTVHLGCHSYFSGHGVWTPWVDDREIKPRDPTFGVLDFPKPGN